MTAGEIIKEIEGLPPEEQAKVFGLLEQSRRQGRRLSPGELVSLADQMVATEDEDDASRLEAKILSGFYGR